MDQENDYEDVDHEKYYESAPHTSYEPGAESPAKPIVGPENVQLLKHRAVELLRSWTLVYCGSLGKNYLRFGGVQAHGLSDVHSPTWVVIAVSRGKLENGRRDNV